MLQAVNLESARQKTTHTSTPRARAVFAGLALLAALAAAPATFAQDTPAPAPAPPPAQDTPAPAPPPTQTPTPDSTSTTTAGPRVTNTANLGISRAASYDNRFEVYGGLSFMNGQAGQNLPKRYNMGGGEGMFTYWVGKHLGIAGDYRIEAGTTPLLPNPYYNRVLIMQNIGSGGVQWRGPKNRYAAVDYHALFGASRGVFDHALQNYPGGSPVTATQIGLYPNTTTPWGAVGGSIDFNYSANLAIRLSPDLIFEHFGTETREFFSMSLGAVYRFGKR
jgi:hypothetical protein